MYSEIELIGQLRELEDCRKMGLQLFVKHWDGTFKGAAGLEPVCCFRRGLIYLTLGKP